ncbi:MAG TPA: prepilin-type N-terminal cleavage/methylation domain-containing protein [Verrucomicrobiae bacterium]
MFIKPRTKKTRSAYTLIELMIGSTLGAIALALVLGATFYTGRTMASLTDSVNLAIQSRSMIDRMSQKIRQAEDVTAFQPHEITVVVGGTNLTYRYQSNTKRLLEIENSSTNTVLENCTQLRFELYRRNPITNSFDQFPADNTVSEAKLVRVSWTCETQGIGQSTGASELVSSKIVLRSK